MLKSFLTSVLLILSLCLYGCSTGLSGLQSYVNSIQGYEFLYPNGWVQVEVQNSSEGVETIFRDIVERTENLSVVVSSIPEGETLEDLGTPSEVGYRFLKKANQEAKNTRKTEFISADSQTDAKNQTYYILEYEVELPNGQERHNIASVAVSRGKLFTFNLSTREPRWKQVENTFKTAANSFKVY
ncbi:MAG: photosystem II reaction center PsbP [Oscillatoria sp. PMC 1068.18]|nr:photosystem II reaction center PsbP [Oscillatoria sp. PMC 1076.18]MEC4991274.1 photosystem II reaction center PsbP [Oscillatoria sp. PMC 1068.18]